MALSAVLAYDISNNNSRSRVAAMVSIWGDRVQRSVYHITLSESDLDGLLHRIEQLIDVHHDAVNVYLQCRSCHGKARHVGQAVIPSPEPYWIL